MKQFLHTIPLLFLMACSSQIDPKQIARVEQNFDKIKPGMTKEQVKKNVGEPISKGNFEFKNKVSLCGNPPCYMEIWALAAAADKFSEWPHVAIDRKTQRVVTVFRAEGDEYISR
jgi:SmpA / OmlA family